MQRDCIFPGRYAPLTYYEDVLVIRKWRVTPGFLCTLLWEEVMMAM